MRHTFVAFDLATASSRVLAALPSQSVIGEINLLTIVIPGRGPAFTSGVPAPCNENVFCTKFLPGLPNYKQVHTEAPRPNVSPAMSWFDEHSFCG